jgi:hypothetical protein
MHLAHGCEVLLLFLLQVQICKPSSNYECLVKFWYMGRKFVDKEVHLVF